MAESYKRCSFRVEDDIHTPVNNGLVTINGQKATLWQWDRHRRRYDYLDRLVKMQRQTDGEEVVIIGESQVLVEGGLLPSESKIIVHVTPRKCAACG